ncbi:activating transcription factor 7-interacting protein 1 isoform X2 [Stigmatopora argus]
MGLSENSSSSSFLISSAAVPFPFPHSYKATKASILNILLKATMEVVVTEEKKKIFRARKTMKISDRQQLETLHSTLLTAASSASEPSPPPLMNGSHREDGQRDSEQNSQQDSNSPNATSPASLTSQSSPAPFLSLNLSPSPVPSQSPKERDESPSDPSSPFRSIHFEEKREEEKTTFPSSSPKDISEPAATESKDKTEEDQTATEDKGNNSVKDPHEESASLPPVSTGTAPMETNTTKSKDTAQIKSSTSNSPTPPPSSSGDTELGKELVEGSDKEEPKKILLIQDKVHDTIVQMSQEEKIDTKQPSKPLRPSSTPPSNTVSEETNCSAGIKRTLSEGCDKEGKTVEREGKRLKMDQGELEAELELKITAKAGSHHKLEKIVQQLVVKSLKDLQMTLFENDVRELKGRVDKVNCATRHQTTISALQAKINRLAKKFGEANQASENKRKQEALAASSALAAAAASAAAAAAAAKTSSVANTAQTQRAVRTSVEMKQMATPAVTLSHTAAKPGSLVPTTVSTTAAIVSQAPIIKLITTSSNPASTLATGNTTQSPTGTLLLKTAPPGGMMTGQPLIIQLPVSMTNGQTGTLVNFPVSSLPAASALNKPQTTASTTTYIFKPASATTTAAGSIPTPITVPALQASSSQVSSGQISVTRAIYQGGAGGITTPNSGVSVTTARTLIPTVSVAGAMSTASSSATSVPAATGSAAPGPPQGTSLTSKTDNQATGITPSKAAAPLTRPKGAVIDLTEDDDDVQVTGVKAATVPSPSLTQRPHPVSIPSTSGARSSPQISHNTSSSTPSVQNRPQMDSSVKSHTSSTTTPIRGLNTMLPPLPPPPIATGLQAEAHRTLPPQQPQLKLVPSNSGIVLSWCVSETNQSCAAVESYHLYAYHQDNSSSSSSQQHWKKIGEVKALPLPMACTLTQFQSGSTYHFAVRAKDIYGRFGPFCEPQCTNVMNPTSN